MIKTNLLYQQLLKSDNFVSPGSLLTTLNCSQDHLDLALKDLQTQGIAIHKDSRRGYKLLSGDLLLPEQISQELAFPVHHVTSSPSTQDNAKQARHQGHQAPALYLADYQTAAVGRFGRSFFACPQGGIYMSLRLSPQLPAKDLPPYTLLVASSLILAIEQLTGIACQIKWVNDIYLGHKKVAGILTETLQSADSGLVTDVVIGIGINFSLKKFPEHLKDRATSLFPADQSPSISRNQLITRIWQTFFTTDPQQLLSIYKERSLVLNQEVSFERQGQSYRGIAIDLTPTGNLVVTITPETTLTLTSGDISLTSWGK